MTASSAQLLLGALLWVSPGQDGTWTQDYAEARARAEAEHKDLLLDFTGSDWCAWCSRLHQEVFDQEAFAQAWKRFVPVTVDFPSDVSILPPGVEEQNEALIDRLPVTAFPTVYLCDSSGRPFARTQYREGGPEPYLEHLVALGLVRELRDAAFLAAEQAKGPERAAHLDRGLDVLPRAMLFPHYADVVTEILSLDPKDSLGLALKYDLLGDPAGLSEARAALEREAHRLAEARDWSGLVEAMDGAASRYWALRELAQFALLYKAVGLLEKTELRDGLAVLTAARERDRNGTLVGRIDKMIVRVREELGETDL